MPLPEPQNESVTEDGKQYRFLSNVGSYHLYENDTSQLLGGICMSEILLIKFLY